MLGNPIKYWLVSVPALVKLSGTKVVQPVHPARGYLHMLSTTSVLGRSMLHMMIVYNRADDSSLSVFMEEHKIYQVYQDKG